MKAKATCFESSNIGLGVACELHGLAGADADRLDVNQLGELAHRIGGHVQHGEVSGGVALLRHGEREFHAGLSAGRKRVAALFHRGAETADIGKAALALGRHYHHVNGRSGFPRLAGPAILVGEGDVRLAKITREVEAELLAEFLGREARFRAATPDVLHDFEMAFQRAGVNRAGCIRRIQRLGARL